jgi:SNF2 family DNA or RNA helicase
MIKLKFDFSQKLSYKQSLYIKGDYNSNILDVIHSFQTRYYHRNSKLWECKIDYFPIILDKLKFEDIQICGEVPKKFEKYLKMLDIYDEQDADYLSRTKPFEHQIESFNYALTHNKFLLGDEQGLGKTKQALDIAVARKHKMRHCLIVCGVNNLKWNWYKEVEIHTNEKAHILGSRVNRKGKTVIGSSAERLADLKQIHDEYFLITNIETLRDKSIQSQIKKMCSDGIIGMTIIDEIHKCKNSQSKQGKAIHCCCSYYRLALTGTPLMNNPVDLYNVLKWLEVENHSLTYFKNLYCEMGGFGGYEIIGYKNLDQLENSLNKNMLRRRKEEVLDLPPKIYTDELLDLDSSQDKLYRDVTNQIIEDIDRIILLPNPLTELIRLRQVTSNPNILTSKNITNVKYDRIVDILESTTDKVIIFSNWTKVINPLYIKLSSLGYNPALVTGESKDPILEMNKFQSDNTCKVILGTTPALGTGYTLTAANTVIFIDEPWSKAIKDQAEDRCHRIGTKGTVNIITLICKDTIDERIHQIIKDKGELSDRIVDGKAVQPSDIKFLIGA